ncbi:MAG: gephyrin-like molybdotransferase Glp [Pseudomonadota bacterium]
MSLIPVDEALRRILEGVEPLGAEAVPLADANGRSLAENLAALRQQPPFAASAMDGYAVRSAEANAAGARLRVQGESLAGHGFHGSLDPGAAVRIFTGAPIPEGADSILIQENAERDGEEIVVREPTDAGKFVRRAGLDFETGQVLLEAPRRLDYRAVALAASMGYASLPVRRKPVVAVVPTGDELVLPGMEPGPDQIVASNQVGVCAIAEAHGARALDLGIAQDTLEALAAKIRQALDQQADILVTLGGASVGEHDLVQEALGIEGMALGFWRIAMRPGKPLMFGRIGRMRVLGLPGNPVSSLVCSRLFLAPLILTLLGLPHGSALATRRAILGQPMSANDRRQDYVRTTLVENADGNMVAHPFSVQDSSMLERFTNANGLIVRAPFADPLDAGAPVDYLPLP